jgi:lantibiotic modifying enzyme
MKSAFRYENAVYDVHAGNWPDFRLDGGGDGPEQMRYGCSWCHGAPGVALSRMRAARLLGRSVDETEISNAVRATQATVDATTFSLCHGFFGNLEVMIEASRAAPAPSSGLEVWMRRLLNELQYRTSDDIGWPCYEGEVGDSPGFMNGVAGIGYSLLRIAGDAGLSSMLVLGAE